MSMQLTHTEDHNTNNYSLKINWTEAFSEQKQRLISDEVLWEILTHFYFIAIELSQAEVLASVSI